MRIQTIAAAHPAGIILREKDLPEEAYRELAQRVLSICKQHGVTCILHTFYHTAMELGAEGVHLPLPVLRQMSKAEKEKFVYLGASCHSAQEAMEAEKLGCTYITAGHIFDTDCKKGLPGRGLEFLRGVCAESSLPVYAIGGISPETIGKVRQAGAAGGCVMSGLMQCRDAAAYLKSFKKEENHVLL